MKISIKELKILIENFLNEEREGEYSNRDVTEGDISFDPYDFYTVTKGVSDFKGVKSKVKDFLKLLGYVVGFEIIGYNNVQNGPRSARKILKITSGKRSGMSQLNAWLTKMSEGESKEKTIKLYSPGKDPFMTEKTKKNASYVYQEVEKLIQKTGKTPEELKNSESLKNLASFIEKNPFSSHLSGEGIDLRINKDTYLIKYIKVPGTGGRKELLSAALDFIKDNNLANFFYQIETDPNHIHIGPDSKRGDSWLTSAGIDKINYYESKIEKQLEEEEPVPYESMP